MMKSINLLKPSGTFTYHQVVFTLHLFVLYESQNKQQLLPYKASRDCFFFNGVRVFTVRYGLNPYIKPIRFVFKGLTFTNLASYI